MYSGQKKKKNTAFNRYFATLELDRDVNGYPGAESCHIFSVRSFHPESLYIWLLFCQKNYWLFKIAQHYFPLKKISIQKEVSKKPLKHLISVINPQEAWIWFSILGNPFLPLPAIKRPISAAPTVRWKEAIWVDSLQTGERLSSSLFRGLICWPRKQKILHTPFPFLPAHATQNSPILLSHK